MIPRSGLRSTLVSSNTCWRNSASSHSDAIDSQSSKRQSRITAVTCGPTVSADDLALLLFHAGAAALAVVDPLDDSAAAVDRAIVHAGSVAPRRGRSQRLRAGRVHWPRGDEPTSTTVERGGDAPAHFPALAGSERRRAR